MKNNNKINRLKNYYIEEKIKVLNKYIIIL